MCTRCHNCGLAAFETRPFCFSETTKKMHQTTHNKPLIVRLDNHYSLGLLKLLPKIENFGLLLGGEYDDAN